MSLCRVVHRAGDQHASQHRRSVAADGGRQPELDSLSSTGAAGVTGSGFIVQAATLLVLPTVPVAGMALILGVGRFMSECRSLTKFVGIAVATIIVARWQRAVHLDHLQGAFAGAGGAFEEAESDALQTEGKSGDA